MVVAVELTAGLGCDRHATPSGATALKELGMPRTSARAHGEFALAGGAFRLRERPSVPEPHWRAMGTCAGYAGHDETLIAYERYSGDQAAAFTEDFRDHGLIRLAIETPDDLIADLQAALDCACGPNK